MYQIVQTSLTRAFAACIHNVRMVSDYKIEQKYIKVVYW